MKYKVIELPFESEQLELKLNDLGGNLRLIHLQPMQTILGVNAITRQPNIRQFYTGVFIEVE